MGREEAVQPAKRDGRTIADILGKEAEAAKGEDLKRLSKADLMQLFYTAAPPHFSAMKGEYRAETIPAGVMAFAADFFTHRMFGTGRWIGKAFNPAGADSGWGYNLFALNDPSGKERIDRIRKMETMIGPSSITEGESFLLNYSAHNSGYVGTMRDEIRMINKNLYLGLGYMAAGGGPINPAPFFLEGPPQELVL